MNKPVLVFVMSEKCGACQNFKKKMLPDLQRELGNSSQFKFLVLDFPNMAIPAQVEGMTYHPDLRNGFIEFFPTLLLFPGNLWNNSQSKLKGVAKHDLKKNPQIDYSKSSINSWINTTLKNDPLFSNNDTEIQLTENGKPLGKYAKSLDNGNYVVPTVGTYNRFKKTKIDDDLM